MTPEAVAAALEEMGRWLAQVPPPPAEEAAPAVPGGGLDLSTLLREFTALRHEVNLQTKAARAQAEQNAEALRRTQQALDALEAERADAARRQRGDADEQLRPLLRTLTELYDALAVAGRQTQRLRETLSAEAAAPPPAAKEEEPEPPPGRRSWWARWLGGAAAATQPWHAARLERERSARLAAERRLAATAERLGAALASLLAGYAMSLQRLERAMRQHGLEPTEAVGQPFDPERMEVLEAVAGSGRPSGEVLEEVRRGYLWNGRVFRCAQVRVARD